MPYRGRIKDGVVVFDEGPSLPDRVIAATAAF